MRAVYKRYRLEFFPAMAAYALLISGSIWLLPKLDNPWLRAATAILPMLPIALAMRAMVRVIRDQDELKRRIDLESIAIAGALTTSGFLALGLLLQAQVITQIDGASVAVWVWPVAFGSYGLVKCFIVSPHYSGAGKE